MTDTTVPVSKKALWAGWIISALPVLMMGVGGLDVVGAPHLAAAVGFLRGQWVPEPALEPSDDRSEPDERFEVDFAEVKGQAVARRGMEISAAGGHNVLMVGPPGAGKTMLARRLATILPTMTDEEALEVTRLHSVAGLLAEGRLVTRRPFRSPHHTVSASTSAHPGRGRDMACGRVAVARI